jgi:hypothetical protein
VLPAHKSDRLATARRALAEASQAAGIPLTRGEGRGRPGCIATGIPGLDAALGGGLTRGRIVEVTGTRSSGRLSLTLALLSRAMHAGEPAALIDAADALDPRALHPDDRARLLWVRPGDVLTALRCADLLLDAGGFALVALYLVGVPPVRERDVARARAHAARPRDPMHTTRDAVAVTGRRGVGSAAWARLAQRAERARAGVLVVLDPHSAHAPGGFVHAALEVKRHRAVWQGRALLETVHGEITVTRSRTGAAAGAVAEVVFRAAG